MEAEFWHTRWEKSEIGFHQEEINTHLQTFWSELAPQQEITIFVPLCGKTRDMIWLRAEGYDVLGVEVSPIAVEAFFQEHALEPVINTQGDFQRWEVDGLAILCGDYFRLHKKDLARTGAVYDRASLIALPPRMRASYVQQLKAILPPAVQMLLITLEYPQEEMKGPPFSVEEQEVRQLFSADYEITRLCDFDILQENPRFQAKGLTRFNEKVFRLVPW